MSQLNTYSPVDDLARQGLEESISQMEVYGENFYQPSEAEMDEMFAKMCEAGGDDPAIREVK